MSKNEKFNNILNQCLDRMFRGETAEDCLRDYPEQAKELEPLLRTAKLAKIASGIQPPPEFKTRARREFQSALRNMPAKKKQRAPFFRWHWEWQSGWAIAAIIIILLVVSGGGTVVAAANSMPDDTLYPVKLASEQVQLTLTFSDIGKAKLNAKLADKRVDEIVVMASKGDPESLQIAAKNLNSNLENLTKLAGDTDSRGTDNSSQEAKSLATAPAIENQQSMMAGAAQTAPATVTAASPTTGQSVTPAAPTTRPPAVTTKPSSTVPGATIAPPVPSITVVVPPAPTIIIGAPPAAPGSAGPSFSSDGRTFSEDKSISYGTLNSVDAKALEREKIKMIITESALKSQAKLNEALNNASPEVRPALRQAIAKSLAESEKALKNLEAGTN